ncbi:diguanylate cyclase domain-containing protein [Poseidonocella sedimentorum]|uniref:guanylate cyclase n=1 Tax=Poseidonocella sedimentorum TaxID=871652 RepID=A0A1I6E0H5_9RHOB|nr:diguanylate cyclase [Poseidonocella sedimentorum]SFR11127.1 diguanylate cyclase (GGDEF) domain-containing protein [Poseidonocella sedimentorum]
MSDRFLIFDRLCPMHLITDRKGYVIHVGPTLRKLRPDLDWIGANSTEIFSVIRPRLRTTIEQLLAGNCVRMQFAFKGEPRTKFKAFAVPFEDGLIADLSFGIEAAAAVQQYGLNAGDFSYTDLTTELLYLQEAKTLMMEELFKSNRRLYGDKIAAEAEATTDALTGLKNRRAMNAELARMIEERTDFALIYLDLDHFKSVNDTLGHNVGDAALRHAAETLQQETRRKDIAARIGGDEFIVLMREPESAQAAESLAARIGEALTRPVTVEGQVLNLSTSIGVSLSANHARPSIKRMLEEADAALYRSKNAGRARVTLASST